ncbi:MAG: tetratricopeptide repeat protein [Microcystis novacekii Mn_MB_F_20050700_S1]|uniref:Tetratricopeptide repeat protein n=1 Tax=Microcystis novacekii Mn_MB_F_20050700_S1D TaxID=2486266 RepID=A0A552JAC9_9CHRO|nr:MAG: tetratricopeptide repeat protein [Microcystis novacekii Mn_MB_F_20050700_S1]TRU92632.1 MAG: tetratricopeptide repeat protein [Microcystis novacekii Mn_MB_F_20050700_S1D]
MFGKTVTSLVHFTLFSGLEINAQILTEEKSARQSEKLISLSKYVQKYPQGWKKRLELANLLYQTGNWQQAVTEYGQVIERQPQLIEVRLKLAKILQLMGLKKEAKEAYEKALFLSENEANQHHIKGLIAFCVDENDEAIIALNLATNLEPDKAVHWLALAQIYQVGENPLGTLSASKQILSINPDDIVALLNSYDALAEVGDIQAARETLNRLIELAGDDFGVLQRQIEQRCQMRLVSGEEGKQTKKMITSLLRLTPDGVGAYNALAYYHILRGDWRQGVEVLANFTAEHPQHPYSWYFYGRCLSNTGDYQKAVQMIEKAYRLYPDDCEIYRGLCEILPLANSPLMKEQTIVEEMLQRFPQRWSIWATAGRVLVEHFQEIERGCQLSQQGIELQPELADAWFRHGRVLALAGKHREAVETYLKGWTLVPVGGYLLSAPAAVWLGESYKAIKDTKTSQAWWKAAVEQCQELRTFNPAAANYWLGRALLGLGDKLGAMEAYQRALSQQLLYPIRGEVEKSARRLKGKKGKASRG